MGSCQASRGSRSRIGAATAAFLLSPRLAHAVEGMADGLGHFWRGGPIMFDPLFLIGAIPWAVLVVPVVARALLSWRWSAVATLAAVLVMVGCSYGGGVVELDTVVVSLLTLTAAAALRLSWLGLRWTVRLVRAAPPI